MKRIKNSLSCFSNKSSPKANVIDQSTLASSFTEILGNDPQKVGYKKSSKSKKNKVIISELQTTISNLRNNQDEDKYGIEAQIAGIRTAINELLMNRESDQALGEAMKAQVDAMEQSLVDIKRKRDADIQTVNDAMKILDARIDEIERKQEATRHVHSEEKKDLEIQLASLKDGEKRHYDELAVHKEKNQALEVRVAALERIIYEMNTVVFKKLELRQKTLWHGYSTLDKHVRPAILFMTDSNDLTINGVTSHKNLILDGVISLFDDDPFKVNARCCYYDQLAVSNILGKVHSCKLSDLFLYNQLLTWNEFLMLVSSSMVKNVYLSFVWIKDEKDELVPLEYILSLLPNIEKFQHFVVYNSTHAFEESSVTKETFKKLLQLSPFNNLQLFKLVDVSHKNLDIDSFFEFMKKHPKAEFTLAFRRLNISKEERAECDAMKQKMIETCPTPDQLRM